MNLIEIWKEACEGQYIKRINNTTRYQKKEMDFIGTVEMIRKDAYNDNGAHQIEFDLLAYDWEIAKEKHVVVIEDVLVCNGKFLDNESRNITERVPDNERIKVTMEWMK